MSVDATSFVGTAAAPPTPETPPETKAPETPPPAASEAGAAPEPKPFEGWMTGLDPDTIKVLEGKKLDTPAKVAASYVNLEKKLGTAVTIPGEKATTEERRAFLTKLGVPEAADKYELKTPAEADGWSKDVENKARAKFLEVGLTPAQAQAMVDFHVGMVEGEAKGLSAGRLETEKALRAEWGGAFEKNFGHFRQALSEYFDADTIQWLGSSPLGNNVGLIKGLARLGADLADAGFVSEDKGAPASGDVQARIDAIMRDKTHPYWVAGHADHERAVQEMAKLQQAMIPLRER